MIGVASSEAQPEHARGPAAVGPAEAPRGQQRHAQPAQVQEHRGEVVAEPEHPERVEEARGGGVERRARARLEELDVGDRPVWRIRPPAAGGTRPCPRPHPVVERRGAAGCTTPPPPRPPPRPRRAWARVRGQGTTGRRAPRSGRPATEPRGGPAGPAPRTGSRPAARRTGRPGPGPGGSRRGRPRPARPAPGARARPSSPAARSAAPSRHPRSVAPGWRPRAGGRVHSGRPSLAWTLPGDASGGAGVRRTPRTRRPCPRPRSRHATGPRRGRRGRAARRPHARPAPARAGSAAGGTR